MNLPVFNPASKWLIATLLPFFYLPIQGKAQNFGSDKVVKRTPAAHIVAIPDREVSKKLPVIVYVAVGGNGNGRSWKEAKGNLQKTIRLAEKGSQIWVAAGTYYPTSGTDRSQSFVLKEGVSLYGGFAGHESSFDERDPACNLTILSGEIGAAGREDNSYTVVYSKNISLHTEIDGFVISGGNANGTELHVSPSNNGAAWFNVDGSPTISNCAFLNNTARQGAALYNYASVGECSSPRISSCSFVNNQADLDGGAVFNRSDFGRCMPEIENSLFLNNLATYGAGVMNQARGGITKASIFNCWFIRNRSLIRGGGIYNHRPYLGMCAADTYDCTFQGNLASFGHDVSAYQLPAIR